MTEQEANEKLIRVWCCGALHESSGAGGFVIALARAVCRADDLNFHILQDAVLEIVRKYPKYFEQEMARMRAEMNASKDGVVWRP